MAKKKETKIKGIEVLTVPIAQPQLQTETQSVVAALKSMAATEGWAIMVKILNDNIKYLETAILEKIDPITKEPLSEAEIEICRIKRLLNIELRDTPQNYSETVKELGSLPVDYDPYYKTKDEIDKVKFIPPVDDRGKQTAL